MFDQANPDTPNDVIVEEIKKQKPALVGLSFLSTTSYPYAKILARQIRVADSTVKLAFGGVFASLNAGLVKLQCPEVDFVCRGDGEQLLLDLLAQMDAPETVGGLTWMKDGQVIDNPGRPMERHLDQWPFPDRESLRLDFIESMPLTSQRALDGAVPDDADVTRLPLAVRLLRHSDLQRRQMAGAQCRTCRRRAQASRSARVWLRLFRRRPLSPPAETH